MAGLLFESSCLCIKTRKPQIELRRPEPRNLERNYDFASALRGLARIVFWGVPARMADHDLP